MHIKKSVPEKSVHSFFIFFTLIAVQLQYQHLLV